MGEYQFNPTMQKGSVVLATVGLVLTIVGCVVNEWLVYEGSEDMSGQQWGAVATVGLWSYEGKTMRGEDISLGWKDEPSNAGENEITQWWFSEGWVDACRVMIIFGMILGGLGLVYQVVFPLRAHSYVNSKMVMILYFLTGISIISTAAIWCSAITKVAYEVNADDAIVKYLYTGSYGWAVWMVWIGGGCFLPAAALAFEGGFVNEKGFKYAELMG